MPILFYNNDLLDRIKESIILKSFFSLFNLMISSYWYARIDIENAYILYKGLMDKYYKKSKKLKRIKKTKKGGGKTKKCRRKRVRQDKNGAYNKLDLKHNEKCAQILQPWMKELLKKHNKSLNEYDKFLKKNIKKNIKTKKKSKTNLVKRNKL